MSGPTDSGRASLAWDTLLRDAYATIWQEAQKSLRTQLRKNPHRIKRSTLAGLARPGVRTHGFFCRRHKSNSSGHSISCASAGLASRCPFAGGALDDETPMHEIDTTAASTAPINGRTSNIHREYQGGVPTSVYSHPRRLAYQGYQGNLPLRADTGEGARVRERPHGRLFYLDILDMLYSYTRKDGGRI